MQHLHFCVQETIERKDADAEATRVEREASDADWESRLEGAVSSAQKWTEFAERLQAEKAEAEGHLAAALADVQVGDIYDEREREREREREGV
jgi:hypothetical protein